MHRCHAAAVMGYVPAVPHFGKETWVDCYALRPSTGRMERKRYKFNRIKSPALRKAHVRDFCDRINMQLRQGWNPWAQEEAPRGQHNLQEACEQYLAHKAQSLGKTKSMYSYRSMTKRFMEWCGTQGLLLEPVGQFTKQHALRYMDHVNTERKVNANTFNGYLLHSRILWNWMVEREYVTQNPFRGVKNVRKEEKFRTLITAEERAEALAWFREHDPPMVMVCMFTFHCLLRPRSELLRIKVRDLDLVQQVVNVSGTSTKSKRVRRPAIPDVMMPYLLRSEIMQAAPEHYVVGKGLRPGRTKSGYNATGNRWNRMRKALGWPEDKVLYSLRDSGIVQLIADGVELQLVMRQADHRNIETTNRYVQHYFPNALQAVREKATALKGGRLVPGELGPIPDMVGEPGREINPEPGAQVP